MSPLFLLVLAVVCTKCADCTTEAGKSTNLLINYVPLDTILVILETFFPANLLVK